MLSVLVLPWSHVLFGSIVGPVIGIAALCALRERHRPTLAVSAVAVFAGTWLWNAMLNVRHATMIDGDNPFKPFPISWQDTGTGIFVFAFTTAALLGTVHRHEPGTEP